MVGAEADKELHILEDYLTGEGTSDSIAVLIFPGEEKHLPDKVVNGLGSRRGVLEELFHALEDGYGEGAHGWLQIGNVVGKKLTGKTNVDFPNTLWQGSVRVLGSSKTLYHQPEVFIHTPFYDYVELCCHHSISNSLLEYLSNMIGFIIPYISAGVMIHAQKFFHWLHSILL